MTANECFANGVLVGMVVPVLIGIVVAVVLWIAYDLSTGENVKGWD
jgi:hypothetical protein